MIDPIIIASFIAFSLLVISWIFMPQEAVKEEK